MFLQVKKVRKKLDTQDKMYVYEFPIKWNFASVIYFAMYCTVSSWAEVPLSNELSDKEAVSTGHTYIT